MSLFNVCFYALTLTAALPSCKASDKQQGTSQAAEQLQTFEQEAPPESNDSFTGDEDIELLTNYDVRVRKDSRSDFAFRPSWSIYYRSVFQNGVQLTGMRDVIKDPGNVYCEAVFRTYLFKFRRALEKGEWPIIDSVSQSFWNKVSLSDDYKLSFYVRNGTRIRKIICTKIDGDQITLGDFEAAFGEYIEIRERSPRELSSVQ